MKKTASLGAQLIATKGAAAPTVDSQIDKGSSEGQGRIAITLKLDEKTYVAMKTYGVKTRTSNQKILENALIEFLDNKKAL